MGTALVVAIALAAAAVAAALYFARRRAREGGEVLRATLEGVGDAVIVTDAESRISSFNRVAEELTGWSAASATGQRLDEVVQLVDGGSGLPIGNPALEAIRRRNVFWLPRRSLLATRDGGTRPVDGSATPVRGGNRGISGCVVVLRDLAPPPAPEGENAK